MQPVAVDVARWDHADGDARSAADEPAAEEPGPEPESAVEPEPEPADSAKE